jgi:DNA-binding response OmpR family regulator
VLTAKGEVQDRIEGLDAGAVDYIVKPFSVAELAARIRAQLRSATRDPGTELDVDGLQINLISRDVSLDGNPVNLSTTEFELLVYLVRNRGQVLSREQILRAVWGYDHDPGTNVVDVYIGYLRRKLTTVERTVPITTIRSVGFRFDAPGP